MIYGHWIISVVEACDKDLLNGHGQVYIGHRIVNVMETNVTNSLTIVKLQATTVCMHA